MHGSTSSTHLGVGEGVGHELDLLELLLLELAQAWRQLLERVVRDVQHRQRGQLADLRMMMRNG